jgi:hypothetical protein
LSDGELIWQFLAARGHRRIVFAGQVESAWPVPGVLVHDGKAYFAAGRHNQLDGGLHVWCLDPATGEIVGRTVLDGPQSNQPPFDKSYTDFDGRSNDIMTVDRNGRAIHLRDIAIDHRTWNWLQLTAFGWQGYRPNTVKRGEFAGFSHEEMPKLTTRPVELHASMHSPYFVRYASNQGKPGQMNGVHGLEGRCLAFGPDLLVTTNEGGNTLVGANLDADGLPPAVVNNKEKDAGKRLQIAPHHYGGYRSLVLTPDRIVVTHGEYLKDPALLVLMSNDGKTLASAELPGNPQPESLAIVGSEIFVGTTDGGLHRFTTNE